MWPPSDQTQELLAGAERGDAEAVNRLLERHRAAVQRMVRLRLDQRIRQRVDASDVVQDVMIEASRRLQAYLADPKMPFHLWLRHIARDRVIDAHRRHRVSAKRSVDREQAVHAMPDDRSTFDLLAQLGDRQLTPAAAATQQELMRCVEAALRQLDDEDCEVLLMRHFEQLSNQEVAQALGLSEPAASMRHLRALRRLRALLNESSES